MPDSKHRFDLSVFSTANHPDSSYRYHKLVWGPHGMDDNGHPSGVLIAGGENGNVILYDPAKIMAGESDVIIAESDRHTGPVRALDVNPFQVCSFVLQVPCDAFMNPMLIFSSAADKPGGFGWE